MQIGEGDLKYLLEKEGKEKADKEKTETTVEVQFSVSLSYLLQSPKLNGLPRCPVAFWSLLNDPKRQAMLEI